MPYKEVLDFLLHKKHSQTDGSEILYAMSYEEFRLLGRKRGKVRRYLRQQEAEFDAKRRFYKAGHTSIVSNEENTSHRLHQLYTDVMLHLERKPKLHQEAMEEAITKMDAAILIFQAGGSVTGPKGPVSFKSYLSDRALVLADMIRQGANDGGSRLAGKLEMVNCLHYFSIPTGTESGYEGVIGADESTEIDPPVALVPNTASKSEAQQQKSNKDMKQHIERVSNSKVQQPEIDEDIGRHLERFSNSQVPQNKIGKDVARQPELALNTQVQQHKIDEGMKQQVQRVEQPHAFQDWVTESFYQIEKNVKESQKDVWMEMTKLQASMDTICRKVDVLNANAARSSRFDYKRPMCNERDTEYLGPEPKRRKGKKILFCIYLIIW